MQGIDENFDEESFKKICKDKGFHIVFCHSDYNKVTNKETGRGSLMLRRSLEKSSKAKAACEIKS